VTIPGSVTSIGDSVFVFCTRLSSVTIPDSVTGIGTCSFRRCRFLRSITIPDSVVEVKDNAFQDCSSLRSLTVCNPSCAIYDSVNTLGDPSLTVLYGYLNSTTQQYAEKWGYTFCPLDGFADVNPAAWYAVPVAWAVENGITAGTGESSFSPNKPCTREQIATMLWRANGSPAPGGAENPFADVKPGKYYTDPVLWAYHHEPRIAGGVSETSFGVGQACNRAQVVTFLWNAAGKPEPAGTSNPFSDVSDADYYYKPVLWALENGVTGGTSPTTFSPNQSCTRAQVVTFLYKVCGSRAPKMKSGTVLNFI
jgi:hypothetical protein